MLIITSKLPKPTTSINHLVQDEVHLHWYETNKRILLKTTQNGLPISLKFLNESPNFTNGDILFEDDKTIITIKILPSHCLKIVPTNMLQMANICYEIGNRHLPLFFENNFLLTPFDVPMLAWLSKQNIAVYEQQATLLQPIKTTVNNINIVTTKN